MKKVFRIFKRSWFLTLWGVTALSLFVWYLGPLFGFGQYQPLNSVNNRVFTITVLFFLWITFVLWKAFKARQKNNQMLNQLAKSEAEANISPNKQATQDNVDHLENRLKEAMQALKGLQFGGSEIGNDKQYLYQLPWYIIIGPPGSGKTTLLANSDLQFPLSKEYGKDALHGVGGTRNCDWWFTNEAVLLDTAGRFTTQDSNKEVDHDSWLGFLDLLKQYRSQQPINGIILAVSISDLLCLSEDERTTHAKAIRSRIVELYDHLNINIPIYMMFTKSDLLAGFRDYFDDLNKEQREQVWGVTFPLENSDANNTLEQFTNEFLLLGQRINQQLIQKIDGERSLERRQSMYLFPQQFSSLESRIKEFLIEIFQDSKFHKPLVFRGVYFTSATQEGSPIDRIISSLANSFGIARQQLPKISNDGKSFFINRLLKQVIFSESGLAGTDLILETRRHWVQRILGVLMGLGCLIIVGLWVSSYLTNKSIIAEFKEDVDEVNEMIQAKPYTGSLADQLPILNKAKSLTMSFTEEEVSPPLLARFGLYQETGLRQQMDDSYRELLRVIFHPHAKKNLEQLIKNNMHKSRATTLFSALKGYLFLGGHKPSKSSPAPYISNIDWDHNGKNNDSNDIMLSAHFNSLFKQHSNTSIKLDSNLVEEARKILSDNPAELAYIQLYNASLNNLKVPEFRIREHEGLNSINESFIRKSNLPWLSGIPGLYTKKGFSEIFLPQYNNIVNNLNNDRWVLGEHQQIVSDLDLIKSKILLLYQDDYIKNWNNFLQDLEIKSLSDKNRAPDILRPLTPDAGNLLAFIMKAVKAETDFSDTNNFPLISSLELKKTLKAVDSKFKPYHILLEEDKLKRTMQLVNELYEGLYQDLSGGKEVSRKVKSTLSELEAATAKLPGIIKVWMKKPIDEAKIVIGLEVTKGATNELVMTAAEDLCIPCQTYFKGKFPFNPSSKKNIDISEFNNFFVKGGILDIFVKNNLKETNNIQPEIVEKIGKFVKDSERVRRAFFSEGGLKISYTLQLISADDNVNSIQLAIGTIKNSFSARSAFRPKETYIWPASSITGVVTFKDPASPPKYIPITNPKDQWGLFKLIKNNHIKLPSSMGGGIFSVETPSLSENPFKLFTKVKNLTRCQCLK